MRLSILLTSLLFFVPVLTGCTNSDAESDGTYTYRVRERAEDLADDLDQKIADAQDKIDDARERIQDRINDQLDDETQDDIQDNIQDDIESALADLGKAMERIGESLQEDSEIQPVDHRKLRDLLPEEFEGMERVNTDGSREGILGIRISKVNADYDGTGREMEIEILDLGSLSSAAMAGLDFLKPEIDREMERENDHRFERTTRFGGFPGFLQAEERGSRQHYNAIVLVGERFVVTVEASGRNLDENILDDVFDEIGLSRLESLARQN